MRVTVDIAGIAIAAIALAVAIAIYLHQRTYKQLTYEFIEEVPLIRGLDNISVMYQDRIVSRPQLSLVRFANTGNVPLAAGDFATPIRVDLQPATVLRAEQIGSSSKQIQVDLTSESHALTVTPKLLNPREWFTISVLLDAPPPESVVIRRDAGASGVVPLLLGLRTAQVDIVSVLEVARNAWRTSAPIVVVGLLTTLSVASGLLVGFSSSKPVIIVLTIFSSTAAGGLASWQVASARKNERRAAEPRE